MRVNPISQNNQSFKAVNQKYYKKAAEWARDCNFVSDDVFNCLRYDIVLWKEISIQDGIDTLNAIKKLLKKTDITLERDLKIYQNLLNEEQSNQ